MFLYIKKKSERYVIFWNFIIILINRMPNRDFPIRNHYHKNVISKSLP
jgi:hypothetical protein